MLVIITIPETIVFVEQTFIVNEDFSQDRESKNKGLSVFDGIFFYNNSDEVKNVNLPKL